MKPGLIFTILELDNFSSDSSFVDIPVIKGTSSPEFSENEMHRIEGRNFSISSHFFLLRIVSLFLYSYPSAFYLSFFQAVRHTFNVKRYLGRNANLAGISNQMRKITVYCFLKYITSREKEVGKNVVLFKNLVISLYESQTLFLTGDFNSC